MRDIEPDKSFTETRRQNRLLSPEMKEGIPTIRTICPNVCYFIPFTDDVTK